MDLKANYDSKVYEERIRKYWEEEKIFSFNPKSKKKIYSIDTPPPTVSGKMHIGHAFQYSQMDFIARFKRMQGFNVFYPFGTDDNGLPTERLVEKLNNVKSKSMDRAKFIELCLKTLKEVTPKFIEDWKKLAISCDYEICYSTIDRNSQKLSQESFIRLLKKDEAYKKDFPSLWCPECQTSIAQAELEDKELESLFSTVKFKADNKDLLIATTRPELIGACVAVFVNPLDKRHKHLIGKKAKVPLFDFEVPIIADKSADMDKGTGVLMVCSYGDKYDAEAITRHKLAPRIILDKDGTIKIKNYDNLKIKDARKKILEDLKSKNLITEQKHITHMVNVHDKCGTEVEILPTEQWFIKLLDKKSKLIQQGKKVKWRPEFMFKRYENWVNGLDWDWNISRDRHFGIPIPVWQCKECNKIIIPDEKELPVDPAKTKKKCSCGGEAIGESKVFDTWQTSSLTPQIASSLVKNKASIPYSLRCNAHDIIRTWDFYTITKSLMHENRIPWENMMVSGFITFGGEKMSKSKGNVISPKDVIEKYSADALRFWAAGSKLGEDMDYQDKDVLTGQKTVTKLWNASKFSIMHLNDYKKQNVKLEPIDTWLLTKLQNIIKTCTGSFENYEYSRAKAEIENFFWNVFCDYYLEIIKDRIYNPDRRGKQSRLSAQFTLYYSLLDILKLFSPIMPFVTEKIYLEYLKESEREKSIHLTSWPEYNKNFINKTIEKNGDLFVEILSKVRKFKAENKLSLKAEIKLTLEKNNKNKLKDMLEDLKAVTNAKEINFSDRFNITL